VTCWVGGSLISGVMTNNRDASTSVTLLRFSETLLMAWIAASSFIDSGLVALGTVDKGTIVGNADGMSGGLVISVICSQLAPLFKGRGDN